MRAIDRSSCWHYRLQKRFFPDDADPDHRCQYIWRFLQIVGVVLAALAYMALAVGDMAMIGDSWSKNEVSFSIMGCLAMIFLVGIYFYLILPFLAKGIAGTERWQAITKPIRSIKEKICGDKIVYR